VPYALFIDDILEKLTYDKNTETIIDWRVAVDQSIQNAEIIEDFKRRREEAQEKKNRIDNHEQIGCCLAIP